MNSLRLSNKNKKYHQNNNKKNPLGFDIDFFFKPIETSKVKIVNGNLEE